MVIRAGVIGHPVGHSLSPALHGRWLKNFGIDGRYDAIECAPDAFAETVASLREEGFAGLNVTAPLKAEALALADEATGTARLLGGANMLTFETGRAVADNSDAEGAAAALSPHLTPAHRTAFVLGAGGTAPALLHALAKLDVKTLFIANRTHQKARSLADRFGAEAIEWDRRNDMLSKADILVNTTALGRPGSPSLGLELGALPKRAVVMDAVYGREPTPLIADAKQRGLTVVDGLAMLVGQAVPGFSRWFGAEPDDLPAAEAHLRKLT